MLLPPSVMRSISSPVHSKYSSHKTKSLPGFSIHVTENGQAILEFPLIKSLRIYYGKLII
jgi:hypothetical protein